MSQPQNLRADDLQHPTPLTPLAAVPETPASPDDVAGEVSIATPRLRAVDGPPAHTVPATVRYADSMTDGALALRLQAITRLGVVSAPTTLTTLAAFTTAPTQAREAEGEAHLKVQAAVAEGRKLAAVPVAASDGSAGPVRADVGDGSAAPVPAEVGDGSAALTVAAAADGSAAPVRAGVGDGSAALTVAATGGGAAALKVAEDGLGSAGPEVGGAARAAAAAAGAGVGPRVPDARAWAGRLVQAVSEVLAGDRPISQLVRFADEAVFADLNRRVRVLGLTTTATSRGARERSAVRSVRVCTPARHVAEVAAHVRHGDRSRAIALRMEIRRHRWICTALEIG
ncbi:Rv3235 family protein [Kribbella sp. NBC_01484]|uniref:Rv3235 family protein n=1 Tax=Kribbella sp. NBC_01484 TaxID=2903579 RepID=UPI002E313163|nr:Rv3235 family protein [Kribbella sp. NBC_01484]